jgi:hypothetical protein
MVGCAARYNSDGVAVGGSVMFGRVSATLAIAVFTLQIVTGCQEAPNRYGLGAALR